MAELEQEIEVETPEVEVETDQDDLIEDHDDSEVTYEQAMEWRKKALRLEKAEKKLVELKKASKTIKNESASVSSKEEVKQILAEERFYEKNPDALAYQEKIEGYKSKGLSLDDAYLLSSKWDREIEQNREIYGQSFVKWEVSNEVISTVSIDTFDRMTSQAQAEYTEKMSSKYGKVRFK